MAKSRARLLTGRNERRIRRSDVEVKSETVDQRGMGAQSTPSHYASHLRGKDIQKEKI